MEVKWCQKLLENNKTGYKESANRRTKKNDDLRKECDDLKLCISSLESHLLAVDRRKLTRRQDNLGPPAGMTERRSGQDRRIGDKTPLNTSGYVLNGRK